MGTRYSIKCWSDDPTIKTETLQADVDKLLDEINQQMSTYRPESELSRFNAAPAGEWFAVSAETAFVTERALHFYRLTNGASDVTVGPLVKLWDFGPGRHSVGARVNAPSAELLAKTKSLTGGEHLEVRLDPPALYKTIDSLEVDLSSIAKGYAVDAVADLLAADGLVNYMIEIGGEVRAAGVRQDGKPWRIGTEAPDPKRRGIHRIIALQDQSLATSGDYRNFRVIDDNKVSHIINPKTGRPLPYRGWSVTLLAPTCLEADALATALLVMGEEVGYNWCKEHDVAALFLIRRGKEIVEIATPKFQEMTSKAE
ncbi:MAG: FAD:protein FMN transferase [Planctomycetes bacterium]|nr:FAD:protein FMN transferase [Planctomycetota bacterium]